MNMQRKQDLKKFTLIKEMMCEVSPDTEAPQQFWHFVGDYDASTAQMESKIRKDEVALKFEQFITANIPEAFDVASNWGPMSGFGIEGIVFKGEEPPRDDDRFDRLQWAQLPAYEKGSMCWLGRLTIKTERGEAFSELVEKLLAEVQGPIEVSDFVLDEFGLHKAVGSVTSEAGARTIIPPRVFLTPLGLFICVPKERLYEMPHQFEPVCQSVVAFSQDIMSAFAREDVARSSSGFSFLEV